VPIALEARAFSRPASPLRYTREGAPLNGKVRARLLVRVAPVLRPVPRSAAKCTVVRAKYAGL